MRVAPTLLMEMDMLAWLWTRCGIKFNFSQDNVHYLVILCFQEVNDEIGQLCSRTGWKS